MLLFLAPHFFLDVNRDVYYKQNPLTKMDKPLLFRPGENVKKIKKGSFVHSIFKIPFMFNASNDKEYDIFHQYPISSSYCYCSS